MIAFKPGGIPWLLAHELRLTWRGAFSRKGKGEAGPKGGGAAAVAWIAGAMLLVALAGGLPIGLMLRRMDIAADPVVVVAIDSALAVLFTLMLSQTLSAATVAFYERGDLDLLLSSPLDPQRTLAVRILAIACNALLLILMLLTPFLIPIAILGHPEWLAAYVMLVSLALVASTAGLWLAMGMFAVFGPRRTKTIAQISAALIGAGVFLASQSYNLFGGRRVRRSIGEFRDWAESTGIADGPLAWPARAVLGEPVSLIAFTAFSVAVFALTTRALGRRFAGNAAAAIGSDGTARVSARGADGRFGDGPFAAMVRKEMRLLLRDPMILSQALLQTLYMVPLAFLLLRDAGENSTALVAVGCGALVFLAGQLGGTLGWITISAEDSPDLLACAPISTARMHRAKIAAVLIPVFLVLVIPLAGLTWFAPWAGVVATAGCLLSASASVLVELWRQRPGKRKEFRRQRGGSVVVTLIEAIAGLFFGAAAGLLVVNQVWAVIPLLMGLGVIWLAKPRGSAPALKVKAAA